MAQADLQAAVITSLATASLTDVDISADREGGFKKNLPASSGLTKEGDNFKLDCLGPTNATQFDVNIDRSKTPEQSSHIKEGGADLYTELGNVKTNKLDVVYERKDVGSGFKEEINHIFHLREDPTRDNKSPDIISTYSIKEEPGGKKVPSNLETDNGWRNEFADWLRGAIKDHKNAPADPAAGNSAQAEQSARPAEQAQGNRTRRLDSEPVREMDRKQLLEQVVSSEEYLASIQIENKALEGAYYSIKKNANKKNAKEGVGFEQWRTAWEKGGHKTASKPTPDVKKLDKAAEGDIGQIRRGVNAARTGVNQIRRQILNERGNAGLYLKTKNQHTDLMKQLDAGRAIHPIDRISRWAHNKVISRPNDERRQAFLRVTSPEHIERLSELMAMSPNDKYPADTEDQRYPRRPYFERFKDQDRQRTVARAGARYQGLETLSDEQLREKADQLTRGLDEAMGNNQILRRDVAEKSGIETGSVEEITFNRILAEKVEAGLRSNSVSDPSDQIAQLKEDLDWYNAEKALAGSIQNEFQDMLRDYRLARAYWKSYVNYHKKHKIW